MRKAIIISICLIVALMSCKKERKEIITPMEVVEITLNVEDVILMEGNVQTIKATIIPEDAEDKSLVWKSSDKNIFEVNQEGKVKAISAGEAILTVKSSNNKYAICKVVVTELIVDLTDFILNWTEDYYLKSYEVGIYYIKEFIPANATNKGVIWSIENPEYASIVESSDVSGEMEVRSIDKENTHKTNVIVRSANGIIKKIPLTLYKASNLQSYFMGNWIAKRYDFTLNGKLYKGVEELKSFLLSDDNGTEADVAKLVEKMTSLAVFKGTSDGLMISIDDVNEAVGLIELTAPKITRIDEPYHWETILEGEFNKMTRPYLNKNLFIGWDKSDYTFKVEVFFGGYYSTVVTYYMEADGKQL